MKKINGVNKKVEFLMKKNFNLILQQINIKVLIITKTVYLNIDM